VQDLVFRVHAALDQQNARRTRPNASGVDTGDLHISLDRRSVMRGTRPVTLDEEEYALLRLLALHGGRVLTMGRLERALWGKENGEQRLVLQKRIAGLRRKIETEPAFPRYILTEPSVGYRLEILPAQKIA
jgi:two-component system KDP operon response regulator KdpE